jgi:hypothetical protein
MPRDWQSRHIVLLLMLPAMKALAAQTTKHGSAGPTIRPMIEVFSPMWAIPDYCRRTCA